MINTESLGHAQVADQAEPSAPIEPTFDVEAEHLLERAAQQIRWLTERNALLQVQVDTVDKLCLLGKPAPQFANTVMAAGGFRDAPDFLYRIESLLRVRKEQRHAEERKAAAANASPDPRSTPLGF